MKVFSVPLNPKLNEQEFFEFIDFLIKHKEYIYDVYFTSRIAPFEQDAMGDVFLSNEQHLKNALYIQSLGFKVSAVYNNTSISPSQKNLNIFINNFKELYDKGIRSATIPFTHWLLTGEIQSEFPELYIKNTIINNVSEPREIAQLAAAGFDYINLDRVLMRDQNRLKRLREVADKYNVKLSLLANEGCKGGCSVMDEHFVYNNTRSFDDEPYFANCISRISCPLWDNNDEAIVLKTANFTPWKEDWIELLEYIDVIKMHGRESIVRIKETMEIIENFASNKEFLYNGFKEYKAEIKPKAFEFWRNKIKTCEFNCFECNACDNLFKTFNKKINDKSKAISNILVNSYLNPYKTSGKYNNQINEVINEIAKFSNGYMETWAADGSATLIAMQHINKIVIIDDYDGFEYAKECLLKNIKKNKKEHDIVLYDTNNLIIDDQYGTIDFVVIDGVDPSDFYDKNKNSFAENCVFMLMNASNEEATEKFLNNSIYKKVMMNSFNINNSYAIVIK